MSSREPEEVQPPGNVLLWTFADQSRVAHAVVFLGGLLVWMGVYLLWLRYVAGDTSVLVKGGPAAIVSRQAGIRAATVACYLWFSGAFMVGRGGPFLNLTLYPAGQIVGGVYLTPLLVFGRLPDRIFTTAQLFGLKFMRDVILFFFPGFLVGLFVTGGFLTILVYVSDADEAWAERHLPPEYHQYMREFHTHHEG